MTGTILPGTNGLPPADDDPTGRRHDIGSRKIKNRKSKIP